MKKYSVDQAQDMRKKGYYVVMNGTRKKVLLVTKNEDDAFKMKSLFLKKNKVVKVYSPLVKMYKNSKEEQDDIDAALKDLRHGKNYR